jgi:hypothetical protein
VASEELIIDLTNYKDRIGSKVAPDRYRVVVEDAEPTESSNHNPMINLWFKIVGGDYDGQTITDRLTITDKSMFRVVGFMQAIGLPTPKKRLKINLRQFIGKTLEVDVEDGEPYNGRIRSEVRGYNKVIGANKPAAESAADEDEFAGLGATAVSGGEETSTAVTDLPTAVSTPSGIAADSLPKPETQPGTVAADTATVEDTSEGQTASATATSKESDKKDPDEIDLDEFNL